MPRANESVKQAFEEKEHPFRNVAEQLGGQNIFTGAFTDLYFLRPWLTKVKEANCIVKVTSTEPPPYQLGLYNSPPHPATHQNTHIHFMPMLTLSRTYPYCLSPMTCMALILLYVFIRIQVFLG